MSKWSGLDYGLRLRSAADLNVIKVHLEKKNVQNSYIIEDLTACLVRVSNSNQSLSDGEKIKIVEALENLTETLNKENNITLGSSFDPVFVQFRTFYCSLTLLD